MRDGTEKTGALSGIAPVILGTVVLYENRSHGAVAQTIIGTLLVVQGLISLAVPRLLPSVPGWSAEQARAHRTAVVAPLTGAISLIAAILLLTVLPASERTLVTTLLAVVLLVAGVLGVLSGLGARQRTARLDSPSLSDLTDETAE